MSKRIVKISTLSGLLDFWRLMKVKHGDSHTGGINKIEIIRRFDLAKGEVRFSSNVEIFARVNGGKPITQLKALERAVMNLGRSVSTVRFMSLCRSTGKQALLETVRFSLMPDMVL